MRASIRIEFEDGTVFTAANADMDPEEQMTVRSEIPEVVPGLGSPSYVISSPSTHFLSLTEVKLNADNDGVCYVIDLRGKES